MVSSLAVFIISKPHSWARETSLGYSWNVAELSSQWKQAPLSTLKKLFKYIRLAILKILFGFLLLGRRKRICQWKFSKALALLNHKEYSAWSQVNIFWILTFCHGAISLATFVCERPWSLTAKDYRPTLWFIAKTAWTLLGWSLEPVQVVSP